MSNKIIIALDCDDVVLNLMESWLKFYNQEFHDNLQTKNITNWAAGDFVYPEAKERFYEYIEEKDVFWEALPVKGALDGVNKLKDMGFRIIYISANNPFNIKQKWLKHHGFMTENIDFVQAYDKSLIHANYLLDDKFQNCVDFKHGQAWLFNAPWNNQYHFVNRIDNWNEFVDMIEKKYEV